MEENLTPNALNELKIQVEHMNRQIELLTAKSMAPQNGPNEKLVDLLLEKGTPLIMGYVQMKNEADRNQLDKEVELEKEEIKVINKLDTKEKVYKGMMLCVSLAALIVAATALPNGEQIVPVLSLVIGLLFKSNSLADFFSHAKQKIKGSNNDD